MDWKSVIVWVKKRNMAGFQLEFAVPQPGTSFFFSNVQDLRPNVQIHCSIWALLKYRHMSNPTDTIKTGALLRVKFTFKLRANALIQTSRSFCSFLNWNREILSSFNHKDDWKKQLVEKKKPTVQSIILKRVSEFTIRSCRLIRCYKPLHQQCDSDLN